MSDITDRIAQDHKIRSIAGRDRTEIAFCTCGMVCANDYDADEGFLAGYWRHIARVVEAGVRGRIAAQIDAACEVREHGSDFEAQMGRSMRIAAEIARGEA